MQYKLLPHTHTQILETVNGITRKTNNSNHLLTFRQIQDRFHHRRQFGNQFLHWELIEQLRQDLERSLTATKTICVKKIQLKYEIKK